MPTDPQSFGKALKELRVVKGFTQKEIVARVPHRYSDESAYRRVERGERKPDRQTVIELLTRGLLDSDVKRIEALLSLAGYEGLRDAEVEELGLERPVQDAPPSDGAAIESSAREPAGPETPRAYFIYASCVAGSIATAALISTLAEGRTNWFALVSSALYAGLYVISLLLETAYENATRSLTRACVFTFCFILLTSSIAMPFASGWAAITTTAGIGIAFVIFLTAAIVQWILVRPVLPNYTIVKTKFHPYTAQAAHLKNTAYFLLIVLLFWLPPKHCVGHINKEISSGHRDAVEHLLSRTELPFSMAASCPNPVWLWSILILMVGLSIPMGAHLLDNLEPHPHRNRYLILFYGRALLYFTLGIFCLGWYSYSLNRISEALR